MRYGLPRIRLPICADVASKARTLGRVAVAFLLVLLSACAQVHVNNKPFDPTRNRNYSLDDWLTTQDWRKPPPAEGRNLIVLSFSGGGVRATALAASVIEELNKRGLSPYIALISSTSGGSVTAGAVAVHGVAEAPNLLEKAFLYHPNTEILLPRLLPSILTGANRSQIFADYLDEQLFGKGTSALTYGDAIHRWPATPFVILNSSDVSTGQTFEFTQDTFDTLCSDLSQFRISEAVAASAAVPVLMTPITLRNHWDKDPCRTGGIRHSTFAYDDVLRKQYDEAFRQRYVNLEKFVLTRHIHSLRYTYTEPVDRAPYRKIEYVHLLDGGLSDNLAARALLRVFREKIKVFRENDVRRILVIQVNAKSEPVRAMDKSASPPSILEVIKSAALNPIDMVTALSAYTSREYTVSLVQRANLGAAPEERILFYPVQIDFDLLETGSDEQAKTKKIGTSWSLPREKIDLMRKVGPQILEDHACFKDFLDDAKIAGSASKSPPLPLREPCTELINLAFNEREVGAPEGVPTLPRPVVAPPRPPVVAPPPPPLPPPAKPAPKPVPKPKPVAEKVTLAANVLFDYDKSVLKSEGKRRLDELVQKVTAVNLEVVIAIGHTDSIGSDAYNQKLSVRRAESVKAYLVSKGVEPNRIYTEGKGEKQPVASNKTEGGRAKNRRVEIEVIGTRKNRGS